MSYNPDKLDTLLIVDDEADLLRGLTRSLSRRLKGARIITAGSGEQAMEIIQQQMPDLILLDIKLGVMGGMEVLDKIQIIDPDTTIVMMTAFGSIELAVESMHRGAWEFVTKPLNLDSLGRLLTRGLERNRLKRDNQLLLSRLQDNVHEPVFVGNSPALQKMCRSIEMVARTDYTVLVRGASGTGKEIATRMIHNLSPRREQPFIMVNCPAIPEQLLESELFGYKRGAFTGANSDHDGLFVQADKGTICLDEIGDIPVTIQSKLLRVLQDKQVKVLGSNTSRPVDVRILSSTNQDLERKIRENAFREDLFYRLNVVSIHTPGLDEIREDIPLLANHFLKQTCAELGCDPKSFTTEALNLLSRQTWPGNVRQLQNTVRRAAISCPDVLIAPKQITSIEDPYHEDDRDMPQKVEPYKIAKESWLSSFTEQYVSNLLLQTSGNISQAARLSGLTRAALQRIMKRHGISGSEFKV